MFILIGELTGKQVLLGKTLSESTQKFREAWTVLWVPRRGRLAQGEQDLECQAQDLDFIRENECIDDYSKKECHLALERWFINSNSLKIGTLSKKRQPDDNRNRMEKPLMQGMAARHTGRAGEEKPGCRGRECSQGHSATYYPFQNPGNVWKSS